MGDQDDPVDPDDSEFEDEDGEEEEIDYIEDTIAPMSTSDD